MKTQDTYPLLKKSLEFTVRIIKYTELLERDNKDPIASKLLKSGMKINSYLYEAQTAFRLPDVKFKLSKAKKSTEEVLYWLLQCVKSNYFPQDKSIINMGQSLSSEIEMSIQD